MLTLRNLTIIFLVGSFFLCSCGKDTSTDNDNQTDEENTIVERDSPEETPVEAPEQRITNILLAYYQDLSNAEINENEYFAPTVEKFFSSEKLSRETVAQSIRNGFKNLESRNIDLDTKSIVITSSDHGYVAEFGGNSTVKRKGQPQEESQAFRNRVTFNDQFEITRYESLNTPSTNRQASSVPPRLQAAKALLTGLSNGKYENINQYIHPKIGYYFITQPGAMSVPYQCNDLNTMVSYAPWFENGIQNLGTDLKEEALPDFDCGDMFSKEGTFIETIKDYSSISTLMNSLNQAEVGNYGEPIIVDVKNLEKYIATQIIDTYSGTSLLLGEIDGKWYLLAIDIATYDCSA